MSAKSKGPNITDILADLDRRVPSKMAEPWDNVGHLLGDATEKYRGAVLSIDLTGSALDRAEAIGANLIVNHHPAIFPRSKGLASITPNGRSALVHRALRMGISVACAHTNFDRGALDAMMWLSNELGATPVGRLTGSDEPALRKLVVTIPIEHRERVSAALFAAGAGHIGNYDACGFSVVGEGTFRGNARSKPAIGRAGKLERVKEARFETICTEGRLPGVLHALRQSHPYEEIAYDVYRLDQPIDTSRAFVSGLGYGFIGDYAKPLRFEAFLERAYGVFGIRAAMIGLPHPKEVRRVAFSPGKGSAFASAAAAAGCDVFITGETGYHDSREAGLRGLTVIEVGHRESEIAFLRTVERWLEPFGERVEVIDDPVQSIVSLEAEALTARPPPPRAKRSPSATRSG